MVLEIAEGQEDKLVSLRQTAEASIPEDMGVVSDRNAPIFFASLTRSDHFVMKFMVDGDCQMASGKVASWLADNLPTSDSEHFLASTTMRCEPLADLYFNEDLNELRVIRLREPQEAGHE